MMCDTSALEAAPPTRTGQLGAVRWGALPLLLLAQLTMAGCRDGGPPAVTALDDLEPTANRSVERCVNVDAPNTAELGGWVFNGEFVGGGVPGEIRIGNQSGWIASLLTSDPNATRGQSSTAAYTLIHVFTTEAPTLAPVEVAPGVFVPFPAISTPPGGDWFLTDDNAVCAAAGTDPLVCRLNNRMRVIAGSGTYANANGFLHNHGTITLPPDFPASNGTGEFHLRGRVCGDGV